MNKLYIALKNRLMQFRLLAICILLFTASCSSKKTSLEPLEANIPKLSKSKLLKKYNSKSFENLEVQTVKMNAKLSYKIGKSSHKLGLKFRIAKSQKIWISGDFLGIPVVKVLIEKNRVRYYNKFDKTYFDGSYKFIQKLTGVKMSYDIVEKLLMGDMILSLSSRGYKVGIEDNAYFLENSKNGAYAIEGFIYPLSYKAKSQTITDFNLHNKFSAYYKNHQLVNNFLFPKTVEIKAEDNNRNAIISMAYHHVTFNDTFSFPYKVPKECTKRITLN